MFDEKRYLGNYVGNINGVFDEKRFYLDITQDDGLTSVILAHTKYLGFSINDVDIKNDEKAMNDFYGPLPDEVKKLFYNPNRAVIKIGIYNPVIDESAIIRIKPGSAKIEFKNCSQVIEPEYIETTFDIPENLSKGGAKRLYATYIKGSKHVTFYYEKENGEERYGNYFFSYKKHLSFLKKVVDGKLTLEDIIRKYKVFEFADNTEYTKERKIAIR